MTVRPETHRDVAIKTIKRSGLNQKLLDNLQSEIDIVKGTPRHITTLIDIINAEHNIYLIMEYCAGDDLTNYMRKRGRVEGLECIRGPGMPPQYYPYPRTCGLDGIVVRSFLRQLEILSYKHYDARVDLWSVGAVLCEMAVGTPPFRANNHVELLKKIERSKGIEFPAEDPSK
ncbi:kinase-like protein [Gloeophyllum trabeum ATCC 11539]|uniref:non-specific serine/threonine protein kinase n=1 Tax=Gloeophyllum trabeum (strain ATCC 11539 / FP-39264 / Madison 617) TaxID=670483 RepID=S7PRM9_GLOTA|nr:kinase-like protein [Gloeophyllum trabeum ATCC 11539]EPQ50022.1 kinase-like protein [Gloeophyllum trabeum ATCC 11539]